MNKNKILGISIWFLGLVLSMVLMFCLEQGMTPTFWITFCFIIVAFVSALFFQMMVWKSNISLDSNFIHIPAMIVSSVYVIVQIPIGIIFSLRSSSISVKIAILINATILIIAWIINLMSIVGNEHISKVNDRQRNHHIEL